MSKTAVRRSVLVVVIAAILVATFGIGAGSALAAGHEFDVSVYHGINGRSLGLGLSKELPVDIYVYNDGGLLTVLEGFTFKSRVDLEGLEPGEYKIMVKSQELDAFLPSMTVGPKDIPGGVEVQMHAKLSEGKTPIIKVKVK
jgi:hypothetical protein